MKLQLTSVSFWNGPWKSWKITTPGGFWGDLGWYSRVENNGWRPLAVRFASEGLVDKARGPAKHREREWKTQGIWVTFFDCWGGGEVHRSSSTELSLFQAATTTGIWNSCGGWVICNDMMRWWDMRVQSLEWVTRYPWYLMILPYHVNPGSAYFTGLQEVEIKRRRRKIEWFQKLYGFNDSMDPQVLSLLGIGNRANCSYQVTAPTV